jgi:hypothetical protein
MPNVQIPRCQRTADQAGVRVENQVGKTAENGQFPETPRRIAEAEMPWNQYFTGIGCPKGGFPQIFPQVWKTARQNTAAHGRLANLPQAVCRDNRSPEVSSKRGTSTVTKTLRRRAER